MKMKKYETVDEYLANFSGGSREKLDAIRKLIKKEAPDAGEKISYGIAAVTLDNKSLVYFAGYDTHVSIYPIPPGDEAFQRELETYKAGKGTLRFALDKPLPTAFIRRVIIAHLKRLRK